MPLAAYNINWYFCLSWEKCDLTDSFAGAIEPTPFDAAQTRTSPFARDAVLRLGADLRCLYADASFAAIFSIDAAVLSGQPLAASALPKPIAAILTTLAEDVLTKGVPHRAQASWQHAGQQRDFEILALPERTAQSPAQAVMVCFSIAPAHLAEARAARAQAEAAVFARDRMLMIASHDLRGPLNAIHSWGHVLERKLALEDSALQRALAGIRTGVEQQVKLIEKVLDAPRAATRVPVLTQGPVVLQALLDDVLANLEATFAGRRGTPLEANLRLPPQALKADAERLWQALWTALAYAVDASAPGAVVVLDSAPTDGAWRATIAYRLAPASLLDCKVAHAFESYIRVEATHARRPNEVPLALSLPKQIIEAHGGEFSAQPAAGDDDVSFLKLSLPLPAAAS